MGKALHAFPVKTVQADPNRGYGEHPWITWPREDVAGPHRLLVEGAGPPATSPSRTSTAACGSELTGHARSPGMNVVEYDLSADPKLADAAEAAARAKARARSRPAAQAGGRGRRRRRRERGGGRRGGRGDARGRPRPAPASRCSTPSWSACSPTRCAARRRRYLPPGRYTVEIRSGGATATRGSPQGAEGRGRRGRPAEEAVETSVRAGAGPSGRARGRRRPRAGRRRCAARCGGPPRAGPARPARWRDRGAPPAAAASRRPLRASGLEEPQRLREPARAIGGHARARTPAARARPRRAPGPRAAAPAGAGGGVRSTGRRLQPGAAASPRRRCATGAQRPRPAPARRAAPARPRPAAAAHDHDAGPRRPPRAAATPAPEHHRPAERYRLMTWRSAWSSSGTRGHQDHARARGHRCASAPPGPRSRSARRPAT